jgi:hypothetical protein
MVMPSYRAAIPRYAVAPNSFRSMRVLARALNHRALAAVGPGLVGAESGHSILR